MIAIQTDIEDAARRKDRHQLKVWLGRTMVDTPKVKLFLSLDSRSLADLLIKLHSDR
jgi:hypothetical protein